VASMSERVRKLQGRITPAAAPVAAPGPEYYEFLRMMNVERRRIDREDAEALGNPADLVFDDDPPEPEPLTEAEQRELADEPVSESGDWCFDLVRDLRAEITDDHHAAKSLDRAIALESKHRRRGATDEDQPGNPHR
jgi:hypothetical protein